MAFKFVLLLAYLAYASAEYIPSDPHSHLAYAPASSYATISKNVVPIVGKTIVQEPQLYHGYAQSAPSVVISKPLAISSPLSASYADHGHGIYQTSALVNNFGYSDSLGYAPVAKTIIAEPTYAKTLYAEPAYGKTLYAEPAYGKSLIAEPVYGKSLIAESIYGKSLIAEPAYAKTFVSEPFYNKDVYAQTIYPGKALLAEPVYGKSIIAQPAPIYGGKVLSYAPNLAYGKVASHGW